jgi:hypothetical protein
MTPGFNKLGKGGLLLHKVGLIEEQSTCTAVDGTLHALGAAVGQEATGWLIQGPQSALVENLLHAFELTGMLIMIIGVVKRLSLPFAVDVDEPPILHANTALGEPDLRIQRHVLCRQSIGSAFLVTGCIIKHEQASIFAARFALEDIDGMVHLTQDVVAGKVAVAVLASLEEDPCLSV